MSADIDKQRPLYQQQLSQHPLLTLLPNSEQGQQVRQLLLGKMGLTHYRKNQTIFLQHDPVSHLYFLLEGMVSCHRQLPNGQECLIQLYDKPSLLNESVLWQYDTATTNQWQSQTSHYAVSKQPTSKQLQLLLNRGNLHQLTAKATQPSGQSTVVATLPVNEYFRSIAQFELGGLVTWFASQVSRRLYQHLLSSDLLTFQNAHAKVSYYLLTHFAPHQPFRLPTTQKQLANQLGLRPETLSRTLHALQQKGLIERRDEQICLVDIEGLLGLVTV
ncbi:MULTISPECIES: Crp/Fnr family transcriptional regulator [unclassified Moraxella]|uniref:Crp/Fnr family transcriptional regulator n=1 Tax=unclassified Moraxella TaxID=2685852 RepID=UPI003AF42F1E